MDYGARFDSYIKFGGGRWYSPLLGRFINADSIVPRPGDPQSLNRYSYVRNSPINRVDPTGHIDIGALILGIGDQFFDDFSLGGWSALNVDVKTRFATEDSVDYNAGRVVGQVAALLTGGGEIGGGVSTVLGSLGLSGLCMAATAGGCIPVAAGVSAAGVVGGTALAGHGVLVAGKVLSNGGPLTKLLANRKGSPSGLTPYEVARNGGKHSGFLRKWEGEGDRQIKKSMQSLHENINRHQGYLANPTAKYTTEEWATFDDALRGKILEHWRSEIRGWDEQIDILTELLKGRE